MLQWSDDEGGARRAYLPLCHAECLVTPPVNQSVTQSTEQSVSQSTCPHSSSLETSWTPTPSPSHLWPVLAHPLYLTHTHTNKSSAILFCWPTPSFTSTSSFLGHSLFLIPSPPPPVSLLFFSYSFPYIPPPVSLISYRQRESRGRRGGAWLRATQTHCTSISISTARHHQEEMLRRPGSMTCTHTHIKDTHHMRINATTVVCVLAGKNVKTVQLPCSIFSFKIYMHSSGNVSNW